MDEKQIKLPESVINSIKEAQETYKKLQENIKNIIPKIPKIDLSIPNFENLYPKNIDFIMPKSMDVVQEENNWERHNELLKTQNTVVNVLKKILEEQHSTSKMTKLIIGLTIAGIVITVILSIF
jgi:hypothetical protein